MPNPVAQLTHASMGQAVAQPAHGHALHGHILNNGAGLG